MNYFLYMLSMENNKEEIEVPGSSSSSSSSMEEGGRGCRSKRKQLDPSYCPVCSVTLRNAEEESHLTIEIEKLHKLSSTKTKLNGKSYTPSVSSEVKEPNDKGWETYQKVRSNRQSRQRVKSRKRKADEATCPICNKEISEDINIHVELCLRRSESNGTESDENIDVESFEEYEWAGQSRVRATSLLQGGVSSLGTSISITEEDEDLVVDGDDSQIYGSPQYTEEDVILTGCDKEQEALRKAVIGTNNFQQNKIELTQDKSPMIGNDGDPVLEVLKNRIRELESKVRNREEIYKCLICMERYHTPVISVCCWHVHCEQCWLQTLGAKKLCPQCNMITSPADLRRIYM